MARLQHRIWRSLTAEWTCRVQQREGHYLLYQNGLATAELRPYGTHALLDLAVRWTKPRYTLYVEGTNLTTTRYFDFANVRQPGLLVLGGCKVRL